MGGFITRPSVLKEDNNMTTKTLERRIIDVIKELPPEKQEEVADFADFIMTQLEDEALARLIGETESDESFNLEAARKLYEEIKVG